MSAPLKTPPSLPNPSFILPLSGEEQKTLPVEKLTFIPYNPHLPEQARLNRENPTKPENRIWQEVLRNKKLLGFRFLRQKPLYNFIADFYCPELLLVIEIDGDSHDKQKDYDFERTKKLAEYGIEVIRYTNEQVIPNPPKLCYPINSRVF